MHDTEAPTTQAERDAAQWRETAGRYLSALVDAERQRDEVGIQLAAAQARIKLLEEGAALLRDLYEDRGEPKWAGNGSNHYHVPCDVIDIGVGCFLSALDAVPGDALAPKMSAALEASGIDSSNVKGVG